MRFVVVCAFLCGTLGCGESTSSVAPPSSELDPFPATDVLVSADGLHTVDDVVGPGPAFEPECVDDEGCAGDAVCSCEGQCVALTGTPCTAPLGCGSGTWCNLCVGQCEPTKAYCEPCVDQGSCGLGAACVPFVTGGTYCGAQCLTDVGCAVYGPGHVCIEVSGVTYKQCVPKSGSCENLGVCEDDGDCPGQDVCNASLGECYEGCTDDGQCPAGDLCVAGRCQAPCGSDEECTPPAVCEPDGRCVIPGSCEEAADCPEPETYCDKALGSCEPGCLEDADCQDASKICEGKTCVDKDCTHNYQCSFGEICEPSNGACVPSPDPHCAPCADGDPGPCGGAPNLCASFEDGEGQAQGEFCLLTCADDPVDACPQGYGCQQISQPDAGVEGFFCTRSCWVDPVAPLP
jgi:hypothetical protein